MRDDKKYDTRCTAGGWGVGAHEKQGRGAHSAHAATEPDGALLAPAPAAWQAPPTLTANTVVLKPERACSS